MEQVDRGLRKFFPDFQAVILNLDGNSTDKTTDIFLNTQTETEKKVLQEKEVTGKGNVLRLLFEYMGDEEVLAAMVVDADLKSITPEWVKLLLNPIIEKDYDYCTPLYSRHKYDGTITNNVIYPLVFGLYGKDIRQPIGGDFSFSGELAKYWLKQKWYDSTGRFGIDNFMTTNAIVGGYKICQVGLGSKKHKPSAPSLNQMFLEVVDTLFRNLHNHSAYLKGISKVDSIPIFGVELAEPQQLGFDKEKIREQVDKELKERQSFYQSILPESLAATIVRSMNERNWVKLLLWYAKNYSERKEIEYLESLRTLYFARVYGFIEETLKMEHSAAEERIKEQATIFFKERKKYFYDSD